MQSFKQGTSHTRRYHVMVAAAALATLMGCNREQRTMADSAGGAIADETKPALAVIDIDIGRHVDSEHEVADKTDDFAPTDTIYAAVHTMGVASGNALVGRWTFEDGTIVDERTDRVTTANDARTVFFIANPKGFAKGKYTLHVLVDGKEVRTKDAKVE